MKHLLLTLLHLAVMTAKLCGAGGVRAVIVENILLKQQLIVLRRARQRAPNLTQSDRLLCGFGSLFLSPGRIRKVAFALRPSTLLAFHQTLVPRKYHRLFSSRPCPNKSGSKGPTVHGSRASSRKPSGSGHHLLRGLRQLPQGGRGDALARWRRPVLDLRRGSHTVTHRRPMSVKT